MCWPSARLQRDKQEQGSSCPMREGPLTGCVHCRIPISCFLSLMVRLNFTYQQHSGSNKEPLVHDAHSNSRTQWASSPPKNLQDNPISNINSFFLCLIFKLIPTKKVRHIVPPSSTQSVILRAFSAMSKGNNQEWRRVGVPEAQLWTTVPFSFRSLAWI